jgi:transposase-like protein
MNAAFAWCGAVASPGSCAGGSGREPPGLLEWLLMRLGFGEAWRGQRRRSPICPRCGKESARASRRHYDGFWALVFRVRPMKCPDCGFYFSVSAKGSRWPVQPDPTGLRLAFQASELSETDSGPDVSVPSGRAPAGERTPRGSGGCPRCGSESVRRAVAGPYESIVSRLHTKDLYRCLHCNASFKRANPLKLLVMTLALSTVLFVLTYLVLEALSRRSKAGGSPTIRDSQLPQEPPPVLR